MQGIVAKKNDTKILVLQPTELEGMDPFMFEATCKWGQADTSSGAHRAGFEITMISEENLSKLRRLIDEATFGD